MARGRGRPPKKGGVESEQKLAAPLAERSVESGLELSVPSTPAPARGRKSLRSLTEVVNSSDPSSDIELEETIEVATSKRRWALSEVRVPAVKTDTRSPSTVSSTSALHDRNAYDTPGTSAAPTPAEFKVPQKRKRGQAFLRGLTGDDELAVPGNRLPKRSRKKSTQQSDEALAQALQQEEYDQIDLTMTQDQRLAATPGFVSSDSEPLVKQETHKRVSRSVRSKSRFTGKTEIISEDESESYEPGEAEESALSDLSDALIEISDDTEAVGSKIQKPPRWLNKRKAKRGEPAKEEWTENIPGWHQKNRAQKDRIRTEHHHPDIVTLWEDLKNVPTIKPERRPQPPGISRQLKPFQLEGVDWMLKQEQTHYKGGLLGDEMGMGKTIQAVSVIMSDYPARAPTLVVVPPVALVQWSSEISSYTDGKLKVLIHHNTDSKVKRLTEKDLRKYDVIMISYSGLESIYRKENKGWKRGDELVKANSRIHAIKYHRLILDEAHNIKQRTTGVAQACFALKADYKWCLSGTPVQNRIGEFFSLLRFLQVKPFASYFCKRCPCAELHWEQDDRKQCKSCKHSGFQHFSIFNKELLDPITGAVSAGLRKEGMQKLRLLTDRIMLRRMKKDHTSSMELPAKEINIHNEFFGDIERDFSSSIMTNTTRQFDTYVSRGVMLNNYANIFGLIMQMRQVANHPDLILKKHAAQGQNVLVCCICDEPAEEAIRSRCHHEFCRKCARDYIRSFEEAEVSMGATPDCPRCHIPLTIDFEQPDIEQDEDVVSKNSIINRINMDHWTSSTKIEMLIYDLYKLRKPDKTAKSIVFSQFTSMLQLVEWRLRKAGISTVMLDGSMSPAQRQKSIEYFMNNVHVEVFLVSLKAGGVALNLTEASRVFIVDPWWNPAAEHQSADRCHRIGQRRACEVTRLVIEDSVESRMVLLQEKKSNMIAGTVDGDDVAMEKLTPEDMGFLFRSS